MSPLGLTFGNGMQVVESDASAINGSGEVVGSFIVLASPLPMNHAYLYSSGTTTDLGSLGYGDSVAYGINDSGQVVGSSYNSSGYQDAFLYSGGVMTDLGTLDGVYSTALGINDSAQVVGNSYYSSGPEHEHAFLYSGGVMTDLNSLLPANSGWTLTSANAVNDNGQIVGSGQIDGQTHAYLMNVNLSQVQVQLTSSNPDSYYGDQVTFTATVSPLTSGLPTPTGSVTFWDGSDSLGSVTLSGGTATLSIANLDTGTHSITAGYSGDSYFEQATSSALLQTVEPTPTTTSLSSSDDQSTYGDPVTFTATVTATTSGSPTPTGAVTFLDGSTPLDTETVDPSDGSASLTIATLGAGIHSITAVYNPDPDFDPSSSDPVQQAVDMRSTFTALTTSSQSSVFGQPVTFTASVNPGALVPPTGSVTFFDGSNPLGPPQPLDGQGNASLTTSSLAVATHQISAVYGGDPNDVGSSSPALLQVVFQDTTTAVVQSLDDPSVFGQPIALTVAVTANAPGSGTPTETVDFYDEDGPLNQAPVPLDGSGTAKFVAPGLPVGVHQVWATYQGDANFLPTVALEIAETVAPADTTTQLTSAADPSVFGQTITLKAHVSVTAPGPVHPRGPSRSTRITTGGMRSSWAPPVSTAPGRLVCRPTSWSSAPIRSRRSTSAIPSSTAAPPRS